MSSVPGSNFGIGRLTPTTFKSQSELDRLADYIRSNRVLPGPGIRITQQGTSGAVISLAQQAVASGPSGGDAYSGQFASAKVSDTTVSIAAGRFIAGTTVKSVSSESPISITVPGSGASTIYLYIECYYHTGSDSWLSQYASSGTYPTQGVVNVGGTDYQCVRVLIATITGKDGAITSIAQEHHGEIHLFGRWF